MPTVDKELQLRNEQELLLGSVKMHSDNMIDIAMDIEPEPVLLPMYQATVTAPLSVRTGPSTGYNKVETLPQGSDVTVWVESQGVNYLWAKISLTEELWVATNWLIED